jgi:GMP reductase
MHTLSKTPKINYQPKLDYQDVLIVPKATKIASRNDVRLQKDMYFKHSKRDWVGVPIVSSNMDTVTNLDTFNVLRKRRMMSCFPKSFNDDFIKMDKLPRELRDTDYYMLSTGISNKDISKILHLNSIFKDKGIYIKFLCFDVANGYMTDLMNTCYKMRMLMPNVTFVAGNIVTPDGVKALVIDGLVDIVKVGIGNGALCTTRKITGVGYPQFSAVLECAETAKEYGAYLMADGGINQVGDISKALCAGGDFVMLGSMLAGHDVSPGETIHENEQLYKLVYGMSSKVANDKYFGGLKNYKAPEGKLVKMAIKGKLEDTLLRIEGGIRSTCTYIGAKDINQMPENSSFITVHKQYNDILDKYVIDE